MRSGVLVLSGRTPERRMMLKNNQQRLRAEPGPQFLWRDQRAVTKKKILNKGGCSYCRRSLCRKCHECERHLHCTNYQDTGVRSVTYTQNSINTSTDQLSFSTAFVRSERFRFEHKDLLIPSQPSYIIWRNGEDVLSWWDIVPGIQTQESPSRQEQARPAYPKVLRLQSHHSLYRIRSAFTTLSRMRNDSKTLLLMVSIVIVLLIHPAAPIGLTQKHTLSAVSKPIASISVPSLLLCTIP